MTASDMIADGERNGIEASQQCIDEAEAARKQAEVAQQDAIGKLEELRKKHKAVSEKLKQERNESAAAAVSAAIDFDKLQSSLYFDDASSD